MGRNVSEKHVQCCVVRPMGIGAEAWGQRLPEVLRWLATSLRPDRLGVMGLDALPPECDG